MHRLTVERSAANPLPLGQSWGLFLSRSRAMSDTQEDNWVEAIGKPTYGNLAEMVAALNCDYDRLEELRDERKDLADELADALKDEDAALNDAPDADHDNAKTVEAKREALEEWDEDNAEELKELEEAAKPCGNECRSREDAEQMIQEDPLSIQVRSGWVSPGAEMTAEEFEILLGTGGPATRIMGELDEHGEPHRAWLEVQDWGKPWTQYYQVDAEVLLTYARCFCFSP